MYIIDLPNGIDNPNQFLLSGVTAWPDRLTVQLLLNWTPSWILSSQLISKANSGFHLDLMIPYDSSGPYYASMYFKTLPEIHYKTYDFIIYV